LKSINQIRVAILIDGAFFLIRYKTLYKKNKGFDPRDPVKVAEDLYGLVNQHTKDKYLYRVLYYDARPLTKKSHNPISNKAIDFSKSDVAVFKLAFYKELMKKRKIALRLGYLKDKNTWLIRPNIVKDLLKGEKTLDDIQNTDVYYDMRQKGVDMRIGLDIASLPYKALVDQIILISGDSDFIPAAKLARREGLDVILDPLWNHIDNKLLEHIDGISTFSPRP